MPRDFFFGLLRVNNWGYDWGFSMSYIELFVTDTVVINYSGKKKVTKQDIEYAEKVWERIKSKKSNNNPAWGNVKKQV